MSGNPPLRTVQWIVWQQYDCAKKTASYRRRRCHKRRNTLRSRRWVRRQPRCAGSYSDDKRRRVQAENRIRWVTLCLMTMAICKKRLSPAQMGIWCAQQSWSPGIVKQEPCRLFGWQQYPYNSRALACQAADATPGVTSDYVLFMSKRLPLISAVPLLQDSY